jgi:hypothetical protein
VYTAVLTIHSWLRWVTLLLALVAVANAFRDDPDIARPMPGKRWDSLFMMALDFQVLLGLALYFGLSPFTREAFADIGAAMANGGLRFWAVEHVGFMILAFVLVRIGRVRALTARTGPERRRRRLMFFALACLVILGGIPWPGLQNGRPLFRL